MIELQANGVFQKINSYEKFWSAKELFENYEPLKFEPLQARHEAMMAMLPLAEAEFEKLSEAGRRCYDFWKQLQPERIPARSFKYTTKVTDTYEWSLNLSSNGLIFKDKSKEFCTSADAYQQLLSDFWFYGPRMPIPDLALRKELVAIVRSAFLEEGPAAKAHFPLFEYPPAQDKLSWEKRGGGAEDFVIVRNYGIEVGQSNWHDGLVFLDFVSFERFLTGQGLDKEDFKPRVKAAISHHLEQALQNINQP